MIYPLCAVQGKCKNRSSMRTSVSLNPTIISRNLIIFWGCSIASNCLSGGRKSLWNHDLKWDAIIRNAIKRLSRNPRALPLIRSCPMRAEHYCEEGKAFFSHAHGSEIIPDRISRSGSWFLRLSFLQAHEGPWGDARASNLTTPSDIQGRCRNTLGILTCRLHLEHHIRNPQARGHEEGSRNATGIIFLSSGGASLIKPCASFMEK